MKLPIFVDSWRKLDKKVKSRFLSFVESPYFNKNTNLLEALKVIDADGQQQLDKECLSERLFPKMIFDDSKVRYILSDLNTLLKEFLLIEFDERTAIEKDLSLTQLLAKLDLDRLHNKEWAKLSSNFHDTSSSSLISPHTKYKYYFEAQEQLTIKSRKEYKHLVEATHQLSTHFISERLKLACLQIGPGSDMKNEKSDALLQLIVAQISAGNFTDSPNVIIYFYAYQMLLNNNDTYYFKVSDWLETNAKLLPIKEVEDIYLLGINFCIARINTGNRDYMKHAFDLYKSGLSSKVFLKDGYLSIHNYKNILRLGLTQKAYEWTESFLHEFKEWLPKEDAENTFTYNLAHFHFQKKDYEEAMQLLREVKFKDVYNNLDSRRMLLRIYYEMEEWSALDSHLDSFQSFTMRQKNIGYHKAANLNLVKITRLMMKKFPLSAKSRMQIRKRIENAAHLAEKDWVVKTSGVSL